MKRPGNALSPCRACHIQAMRDPSNPRSTLYVPHLGRYNAANLPLRKDLRAQIQDAIVAGEEWKKKLGISRASILLQLPSIHYPRSFPLDMMHAVLQNITVMLWRIWIGDFHKFDGALPPVGKPSNYVLSKAAIDEVRYSLHSWEVTLTQFSDRTSNDQISQRYTCLSRSCTTQHH